MFRAQFNTSLKKSKKLLKKFSLVNQIYPRYKKLSDVFLSISKKQDHYQIYKTATENFDYDIVLFDQSILQFDYFLNSNNQYDLRYAYYQQPFNFLSYEDYLRKNEFNIDSVRYFFRDEYEQELNESEILKNLTAIRYDFSMSSYKPSVHSVSHLHIGLKNQIRIPSSIILTPFMFVMFVLRHVYYEKWNELMSYSSFNSYYNTCKNSCMVIDNQYFQIKEKNDLYLI